MLTRTQKLRWIFCETRSIASFAFGLTEFGGIEAVVLICNVVYQEETKTFCGVTLKTATCSGIAVCATLTTIGLASIVLSHVVES